MRRAWLLAALLLVLAAPAIPQQGASGLQADPGEVGGLFFDTKTGAPLRSVRVTVRGRAEERRVRETRTGFDGRFLFTEVPAGEYSVMAEKAGYGTQRRFSELARFHLAEGESQTNLEIGLRPSGVISGRVTDSYGDPLAGAEVLAYRRWYEPGRPAWDSVGRAATNDLGEYRVFGLPPGKYVIAVRPSEQLAPDGTMVFDQALTFYPQAPHPNEAAAVTVKWGTEVDGIDVKMAPAPPAMLSGIVYGSDGKVAESYLDVHYEGAFSVGSVSTTEEGRFAVYGIRPGVYQMGAFLRQQDHFQSAQRQVAVPQGGVEGVAVRFGEIQTVSGVVILEDPPEQDDSGQGGRQRFRGVIRLEPSLFTPMSHIRPVPVPERGGAFELRDVPPGRYHIRVRGGPHGSYLREIRRSGRPLNERVIEVGPYSAVSDLELRFSYDGAAVSGVVRPSQGDGPDPVGGRIVALAANRESATPSFNAPVAHDGSFQLFQLPPGEYALFALPAGSQLDLWNLAVRRAVESYGEKIDLEANENATIELTLVKEPEEPL